MTVSNFDLIFENSNIVVVDKPSGYLSVPSRMGEKDKRPCLGKEIEKQLKIRLFPVHRLDEETSGLIIFAKTQSAHKMLSGLFEKRKIQKYYQAITAPSTSPNPQNYTRFFNKIIRGKKRTFEADYGEDAITEIIGTETIILENKKFILWQLKPLTGRSHQLRFQLFIRSFMLLGDELYGSQMPFPTSLFLPTNSIQSKTIALRAIKLDFGDCLDVISDLKVPQVLTVKNWPTVSKLI